MRKLLWIPLVSAATILSISGHALACPELQDHQATPSFIPDTQDPEVMVPEAPGHVVVPDPSPMVPSPWQLRRSAPSLPSPWQLRQEAPSLPSPQQLREQPPALTLPPRIAPYATPIPQRSTRRPSPPARVSSVILRQNEEQIVHLLNNARRRLGLRTLRIDPKATLVARAHSADMCRRHFFDHKNPDGLAPWHRLSRGGARFLAAAENIAVGYLSAHEVHRGWMKSPGHRQNRLNKTYRRVGVGTYRCGNTTYFTELFLR